MSRKSQADRSHGIRGIFVYVRDQDRYGGGMADLSTVRVCRRCLLRELNETEYREKLERYIVGLDQALKAPEALYEKRLSVCRECEKLSEGTCLSCGCYVELRAAVKESRCPNKKW